MFWKKHKNVRIQHYAPDVELTSVDYILPDHEKRLHDAEIRIKAFLANASPDELCDGFFDPCSEREGEFLIRQLQEQLPNHADSNQGIIDKHHAELQRLDRTIVQTQALIEECDSEIDALEALYKQFNGLEVMI